MTPVKTTTTTASTTPLRSATAPSHAAALSSANPRSSSVRLGRAETFRAASTHARGEDGDHFQRARARFARGPSSARGPAGPAAAVHHAPGVRERAAAVPGAAELRRAEVLRPGTRAPARGPAEEPPRSRDARVARTRVTAWCFFRRVANGVCPTPSAASGWSWEDISHVPMTPVATCTCVPRAVRPPRVSSSLSTKKMRTCVSH